MRFYLRVCIKVLLPVLYAAPTALIIAVKAVHLKYCTAATLSCYQYTLYSCEFILVATPHK